MDEFLLIRQVATDQLLKMKQSVVKKVTVPPTKFAHYILNSLSFNFLVGNLSPRRPMAVQFSPIVANHRQQSDDELALDLALEVLGMRVYISETDHPMLCECIRRQRRDLQFTLLQRNKDCTERIAGYNLNSSSKHFFLI